MTVWTDSKGTILYGALKKGATELIDTKNRLLIATGWAGGQRRVKGVKRYIFPVIKEISHEVVMYNLVTIVNNTVLII